MTTTPLFSNAPDLQAEDYCVFGLATCFVREEGEVREVYAIEPIPSAALEALLKGIPTSYQFACGKSLCDFYGEEELHIPAEFPNDAQLCQDFTDRAIAATRTYKNHPEAQNHIPLGTQKDDFNYSIERKRLLNAENIVRTEDNIKQHPFTHQVV
ncbi:hypothetical protein [Oscillatoria sp. FACHB-1406]|uniref:hypothetical protein n=1 Tax=Oscillatoria sp. FACHB-1406 TaxID=2692846 RepID=UPI001681D1EF|nr:hypothetical protein [Oscillatoria sp. FACHB-1406]MBD2577860.1 hypothetical protein [Oscillatoria sp. FACHB-1406]